MSNDTSFTGRGQRRRTRRSVVLAERAARLAISVGGIGTILAVFLIFFFLLWVIVPLFRGGAIGDARIVDAEQIPGSQPLAIGLGPSGQLAWSLDAAGRFRTLALADGRTLALSELAGDTAGAPTSVAMTPERTHLALGYADGSVVIGAIEARRTFLSEEQEAAASETLRALQPGQSKIEGDAAYERTPTGQLRRIRLEVVLSEPVQPSGSDAVGLLDLSVLGDDVIFASLDQAGRLGVSHLTKRYNMLEDREVVSAMWTALPYQPREQSGEPRYMVLDDLGQRAFLAWDDGLVQHYRIDQVGSGVLEEQVDLVSAEGAQLVSLTPLLGKGTLIAVDDQGDVSAWFTSRATPDSEPRLVRAHQLPGPDGARVTAVASAPRSRLIALGTEQGGVELVQVTSEKRLALARGLLGAPVEQLAISERQDELLALAGGKLARMSLDVGHPEASLKSLFAPIWYEGYPGPAYVWQSTSGSDDFEPKMSLTPLIFGTLKATFYSMAFGAPLAILAAMFSSEYLKGRVRTSVKATLELMASLPSVVLGFMAAMLIAPHVQQVLPAVLALFVALPFTLLLGAHLWQLLPRQLALRWSGWQRLMAISLALLLALPLAELFGPLLARMFFAGDVEAWLGGRVGSGTSGWMFLFLPVAGLLVALLNGRLLQARLRDLIGGRSLEIQGRLELLRFLVNSALVVLVALLLSLLFTHVFRWDPRGSIIGPYDQRNALVVGFVMGFAIIPIIYTLAEDAFTSVPSHLREASLGAGATPWQTATRVILPTAMSGVFSAVMIGLGRAVGETMIVLMATGGTAIMDWNVFNGFRTLSANIATELPEAVKNSTHYRALFLAGFVLFVMTFLLNTLAEVVRQRFRKRAFQL